MTGLLALAFGAGLLAPVNPCGFGLLPAMLTATLGHPTGTRQRDVAARLAGGLRAGLALTVGLTTTFVVIGIGLTAGIRSLITVVPWIAAGIGAILGLVGLALLAGWHLPVTLPGRQPDHTTVDGGIGRIVVFGAGYAIASASCTLAVLLAVVTQAAATTLIGAVAVFAAYAAGSALLLITLAVAAAVAGHALAVAMQRAARYAGRIAGALLAVSGAYLVLYWLPQLLGTTPARRRRTGRAGRTGGHRDHRAPTRRHAPRRGPRAHRRRRGDPDPTHPHRRRPDHQELLHARGLHGHHPGGAGTHDPLTPIPLDRSVRSRRPARPRGSDRLQSWMWGTRPFRVVITLKAGRSRGTSSRRTPFGR